jgi:uncharacterized protein YndB with AHSA1/START domain
MTTNKAQTVEKPAFELTLTRVINAPRERVFQAWSEPKQVQRWFAPQPLTLPKCEMDFRPGGSFNMAMRAPDGQEYPFSGVYSEIVPPAKLVWIGQFPNGPANQIRTTVIFEAQGNKTKLTVQQIFTVMTPETEPHTKGAKEGWTATLNQLTEYAEKAANKENS